METIINEQAIPSTIARLTDIPDISDTYYVTDFTVEDLRNMIVSGNQMQTDTQAIATALNSNKIVLVPYASGTGYELLTGYDEDFLYAYVSSSYYGETYFIETATHTGGFDATNCNIATMISKETADRTFISHEPAGDLEIVVNVNALRDDNQTYALPTSATGDEDDIIATKNTLKTINGESIVGSGDITISGGSSSGGSGAYSEVNHGTADTTFTLTPNTFHVWDEVASLTLDFGSETSGVANEFLFQFTSGATATSLTLPDDIKWANDSAPTIAENMIYQVSILKGLASVLSWEVELSIVFPITLEMGDNGDIGISLYSYLQSTYGEPTSGTTLNEEIINNYNGVTFETIEYATYVGFTGYWLNGYSSYRMSWVLLEDGYLQRVLPPQEN